MSKPRVLLSRRWPQQVESKLQEKFDVSLNANDQPLTKQQLIDALQNFDGVCPTVTDKFTTEIFATDNIRTKIIANFGVGYNHIDLQAASAKNIVVTNTPDVLTDCTADLAMTLLLMLARRAGEGERCLRGNQWHGWHPIHMMGSTVTAKTLAIIGMGRIGLAMARRAYYGFGMRIFYHNRTAITEDVQQELKAQYFPEIEQILPEADFVSLHCVGSPETWHLINIERLQLLKPTAFIINTARGDIIDEKALVIALQQGWIAGAGLDVYEAEPRVPQELKQMENVVLLPHLGSATLETRVAMGMCVVENLEAFFSGLEPKNKL